jgi:putative transposase
MSRLRRLVLSDRFFFVTCRLLPHRGRLMKSEFECLARVVGERREKHQFLLTAWVFLPDHWHAILFPRFPLTVSRVKESIKVGSTLRINAGRKESGLLWQPRYWDRAVRTVKEYHERVEYIHLNPVRAGLVERAEAWPWPSVRDYSGNLSGVASAHRVLPIDRILLPAEERTRI